MTVIELLVGVTLGMLMITSSVSITSSFMSRLEISGAVTVITSNLSRARYLSLSEKRKVRFRISENQIQLERLENSEWKKFRNAEIRGNVNVSINAFPVFSPTGTSSPLCSIRVSNKRYSKTITLSFAGRIKVRDL